MSDALVGQVRGDRPEKDDIEGASLTLTSLGQLGGKSFVPIINAPEIAMPRVARARMHAAAQVGQVAARLMLPLSLPCDRRVVGGAAAGRLMEALRNSLAVLTGDNDTAFC